MLVGWTAKNPTKEVQFTEEVIFEEGQLCQKVAEDIKRRNLDLRKYGLWFRPHINVDRFVFDVHGLVIKVLRFFIRL